MKPYALPISERRAYRGMLLDFNERTVSTSPIIKKAILNLLKSDTLQLYPEYGGLEVKLAKYAGVDSDQILITNGSDQGIDLVFRTFTETGDTVIIPTPSFAMFSQSACISGNKILRPMYAKKNLSFPLDDVLSMINGSIKLIVLCNPNNPTGTAVSIDGIEQIAQRAPNAIILVDEAYFEFSALTAVTLIEKYPNIIVIRTLSKAFGLSSLRIGYIVASKNYINEFSKIRGPFDVNMIAYTASLAALEDLKDMQRYVNEVMKKSKPMIEKFFFENDIRFYASAANFILYKPIQEQEEKILRDNGILVRAQDKTNIENTLRLTIGTIEQMKQFIKVYRNKILKKSKSIKYAFIDRDGTLIFEPQDTFQIDSIEKLKILDGVIPSLNKLSKKGYELIMVSNQDGLGTSAFPLANFEVPQNKMLEIFEKNGITFTKIYICPHMPSESCMCRKPKIGLVKKFLKVNQIDKNNSFVCGDRETDRRFAKNIGIKYVSMKTNGNFQTALSQGGIIV